MYKIIMTKQGTLKIGTKFTNIAIHFFQRCLNSLWDRTVIKKVRLGIELWDKATIIKS